MKILVTTDYSSNSAGAIRFVQALARQSNGLEVAFYHAVQFLKPTKWSQEFYESYKRDEISRLTAELRGFVNKSLGKDRARFAKIDYVIDPVVSTSKGIIAFAERKKIDFICIATQGAGILRKIMGTHSSYIVNHSTKPVFIIPSHFHVKPLQSALYLSDFENLKREMKKVGRISNAFGLKVEVLHYNNLLSDDRKMEAKKELFSTPEYANFKLNISSVNLHLSLVDRISKKVRKSKPELIVMFTNQKKGFFENIFLPSKTAELTYSTRVPVLVFPK